MAEAAIRAFFLKIRAFLLEDSCLFLKDLRLPDASGDFPWEVPAETAERQNRADSCLFPEGFLQMRSAEKRRKPPFVPFLADPRLLLEDLRLFLDDSLLTDPGGDFPREVPAETAE